MKTNLRLKVVGKGLTKHFDVTEEELFEKSTQ